MQGNASEKVKLQVWLIGRKFQSEVEIFLINRQG